MTRASGLSMGKMGMVFAHWHRSPVGQPSLLNFSFLVASVEEDGDDLGLDLPEPLGGKCQSSRRVSPVPRPLRSPQAAGAQSVPA